MRSVVFANDEIYHVFNRGVERRPTFTDKNEYTRAITSINFYRFQQSLTGLASYLKLNLEKREALFNSLFNEKNKLVEIISYCLMPNHFHLLLKQVINNGISIFLSNFTNSYTRYFNIKHTRIGPLYQGVFKAVRMESTEQLIYVNRYVHLNPISSLIVSENKLDNYPWSSLAEYLGMEREKICNTKIVLDQFSSVESYRKYMHDQIDYAKKLEQIKHLILED